jgi:hypothetical protein
MKVSKAWEVHISTMLHPSVVTFLPFRTKAAARTFARRLSFKIVNGDAFLFNPISRTAEEVTMGGE